MNPSGTLPPSGQQLFQVRRVDRLDQVAVSPGLPRPLLVALLTPAGQRDDDDGLPPGLPPGASGVAPAPSSSTGSRTVNVLPFPAPALSAVTLPPCISTSPFTSASP